MVVRADNLMVTIDCLPQILVVLDNRKGLISKADVKGLPPLEYFNYFSAETDFICQNLMFTDVRFSRIKMVLTLKGIYNIKFYLTVTTCMDEDDDEANDCSKHTG